MVVAENMDVCSVRTNEFDYILRISHSCPRCTFPHKFGSAADIFAFGAEISLPLVVRLASKGLVHPKVHITQVPMAPLEQESQEPDGHMRPHAAAVPTLPRNSPSQLPACLLRLPLPPSPLLVPPSVASKPHRVVVTGSFRGWRAGTVLS